MPARATSTDTSAQSAEQLVGTLLAELQKLVDEKAEINLFREYTDKTVSHVTSVAIAEQSAGATVLVSLVTNSCIPLAVSVQALGHILDLIVIENLRTTFVSALLSSLKERQFAPIRLKLLEQWRRIFESGDMAAQLVLLSTIYNAAGFPENAKDLTDETWGMLADFCIFAAGKIEGAHERVQRALQNALNKVFNSPFIRLTAREQLLERIVTTLRAKETVVSVKIALAEVMMTADFISLTRRELLALSQVFAELAGDPALAATKIAGGAGTFMQSVAIIWMQCLTVPPTATPQFQRQLVETAIRTFLARVKRAATQEESAQAILLFTKVFVVIERELPTHVRDYFSGELQRAVVDHKSGKKRANVDEVTEICAKLQRQLDATERPRTIIDIADLVGKLRAVTDYDVGEQVAIRLVDAVQQYEGNSYDVLQSMRKDVLKTTHEIITDKEAHWAAREGAAWAMLNIMSTLPRDMADAAYEFAHEIAYYFPANDAGELESQRSIVVLVSEIMLRTLPVAVGKRTFSIDVIAPHIYTPKDIVRERLEDFSAKLKRIYYRPVAQLLLARILARLYKEQSIILGDDELEATLEQTLRNCLQQPEIRETLSADVALTIAGALGISVVMEKAETSTAVIELVAQFNSPESYRALMTPEIAERIMLSDELPLEQRIGMLDAMVDALVDVYERKKEATSEDIDALTQSLLTVMVHPKCPTALLKHFQALVRTACQMWTEKRAPLCVALASLTFVWSCQKQQPSKKLWRFVEELGAIRAGDSAVRHKQAIIVWTQILSSQGVPASYHQTAITRIIELIGIPAILNDAEYATMLRARLRSLVIGQKTSREIAERMIDQLAFIVASSTYSSVARNFIVVTLIGMLDDALIAPEGVELHLVRTAFAFVLSSDIERETRLKFLSAIAYYARGMGVCGMRANQHENISLNVSRELIRVCEEQVFSKDELMEYVHSVMMKSEGGVIQEALRTSRESTDPARKEEYANEAVKMHLLWESACKADWSLLYDNYDTTHREAPRIRAAHEKDGTFVNLDTDHFYTDTPLDLQRELAQKLKH